MDAECFKQKLTENSKKVATGHLRELLRRDILRMARRILVSRFHTREYLFQTYQE